MQSVSAAFTAEERDKVRSIATNLQVSWKKFSNVGNRTFTIGVSTIGSHDVIGLTPGSVSAPGLWQYEDESAYALSYGVDRSLNIPLGGYSKSAGEFQLDNTSGRFLPDYMGGTSALYTAVLPRRPFIINAGFVVNGTDYVIPRFAGLGSGQPEIDEANKRVSIHGFDYTDYFADRAIDHTSIYTGQTTDTILQHLLVNSGMGTSQYDLDVGLNTIPFAFIDKGEKYSDVINEMVQAENGHFFQDETGVFKFWNRQHWSSAPYTQVQRIIATSQVINTETPNLDNLINVVEIKSQKYAKQDSEQLFKLSSAISLPSGSNTEVFVNFDNPVLQLDTVSFYVANTLSDETGTDITSNVYVKSTDKFSKAAKIIFVNNSGSSGYLTQLTLYGRTAKPISDIYLRSQDDSSVTAYEEHPVTVENKYIQNDTWASSLASLLLGQYSEPDRLQKITIRAIPELQFGDLISWRGRSWRVYGIKDMIDASSGYLQQLIISNAPNTSQGYFTIGVSTIGGNDIIAA